MNRILGRVLATLVIVGIIGFLSVPALAAGLPSPASSKTSPSRIIFIKINDGTGVKMFNTTKAPLVLDKQGYRYKPADAAKTVTINNDVRIMADNVEIDNAVIAGDLYVYGNNVRLYALKVNGAVFIADGQDVAIDYCTIVSEKLEIMGAKKEDAASDSDEEPDSGEEPNSGEELDSNDELDSGEMLNPSGSLTSSEALNSGEAYQDIYADAPENAKESSVAATDRTEAEASGGSVAAGSKPTVALLEAVAIDDYNDKFVVANKTRTLPANWKPKDLAVITVPYRGRPEAKYMRKEASDALARMFAGAKKDGILLCAISGFRSYELQKSVYYKYTRQLGEKTAEMVSAKPGSSEHQTGLAIDISSKSMNYALSNSFANTREGKWLAKNAAGFGFILRYPKGKEAITGYVYEPWHFRYIGTDLAADIAKKGQTLEEYYGIAPKTDMQKLIAGRTAASDT